MNKKIEALFKAIDKYDIIAIDKLIKDGADVNAVNEYGETALSFAMESKSPKVIETLLKHGAKTGTQLKNHRIAAKRK